MFFSLFLQPFQICANSPHFDQIWSFLATPWHHHSSPVSIARGYPDLCFIFFGVSLTLGFSSGLATSPHESTQLVMRILRNIQAKQGISVVVPQLERMHLLVPEDHSCFTEAQRRRDMGEALVQVLLLLDTWPSCDLRLVTVTFDVWRTTIHRHADVTLAAELWHRYHWESCCNSGKTRESGFG